MLLLLAVVGLLFGSYAYVRGHITKRRYIDVVLSAGVIGLFYVCLAVLAVAGGEV